MFYASGPNQMLCILALAIFIKIHNYDMLQSFY